MSNHTPGPWETNEFDTSKGESGIAIYAGDDVIADLHYYPRMSEELRATIRANAQLIATAPDMLDALKKALPLLEASFLDHKGTPNGNAIFEGLEAVRDVIADLEQGDN